MEILSKRKIEAPLFVLRFLSAAIVVLAIYLFRSGVYDYAVFFCVLLIPVSLIGINQVIIEEHEVTICQHRLFASLCYKYKLKVTNILMVSVKEESIDLDDAVGMDDNGFLTTLTFINPVKEIKINATEFKYLDKKNDIKTLTLKLQLKEYKLASDVLNRD